MYHRLWIQNLNAGSTFLYFFFKILLNHHSLLYTLSPWLSLSNYVCTRNSSSANRSWLCLFLLNPKPLNRNLNHRPSSYSIFIFITASLYIRQTGKNKLTHVYTFNTAPTFVCWSQRQIENTQKYRLLNHLNGCHFTPRFFTLNLGM